MPFDLSTAKEVTPASPEVADGAELGTGMTPEGFAEAKLVALAQAPVSETLTGKERAGVSLTWGVLVIILIFR